jgi:2-polyprenyl-6-methoxyphenol hydroxylase-like FAD-dependent oxidoreductase
VTKAACDAEALARHLGQAGSVEAALAAYSRERQPAGATATRIARELGAMIFAEPVLGTNTDGRNNPNLETIVMDTAVVPPELDVLPA